MIGIDVRRAARRQIARQGGDGSKEYGDPPERQRIERADLVKKRARRWHGRSRASAQPATMPIAGQEQSLADDEAEDFAMTGAERDAHADLLRRCETEYDNTP